MQMKELRLKLQYISLVCFLAYVAFAQVYVQIMYCQFDLKICKKKKIPTPEQQSNKTNGKC